MTMRLLALLVLLPFMAHADEVVTRKDGSQVLLKEDGSWAPLSGTVHQPEPGVIIVQPAAGAIDPAESVCQPSDTYQVLDEQYRNLGVQLEKMAAAKAQICLDGYIQVWWPNEEIARILYTRPTQNQQEDFGVRDQIASLAELPREQRIALLERCKNNFCRAAVYGRMTDETTIVATSVALHQTTVPPLDEEQ
jgi:hypothetical protein